MKEIEKAIYTALKASDDLTTLVGGTANPRIYNTHARQGATMPIVVFQKQGGGHVHDTPAEAVEILIMAKAVSDSLTEAESIDHELKNALDRATLTVENDYAVYAIWKENHLHFAEDLGGGKLIYHIGAIYRVFAGGTT